MTEIAGAAAAVDMLTDGGRPHAGLENAEAHRDCANCGTHLQGPYCHACGQKAHLHSRLRHLLHELVEGIAHFDGRFWRTLPLLAFRPGKLSRSWIEGKRARYVSPLHIFLFSIFLLFIIPTFTGRHLLTLPKEDEKPAAAAGSTAGGGVTITRQAPGAGPVDMQIEGAPGADSAFVRGLGKAWKKAKEDPEYYGYKIESLAYKLSFIVVPISMVILALLLVFKRGYSLYDHGVVSLYGVGFFALMLAVLTMLPAGWGAAVGEPLVFVGLAHAILHLRGAYRLSWFGAVLRGLFLGLFSMIGFGLFIMGVYALGLFV